MTVRNQHNVCEIVVANNLCVGCGLCVTICPHNNLRIEFNERGEYIASKQAKKCPDPCGVCLKICPFAVEEQNEDTLGNELFASISGMKHTPETGYYLDSLVGYSTIGGHRVNGASGGLATWTLEMLLKENMVDYVACVSPTHEPGRLFKYVLVSEPKQVRTCSRSCYYPVETSAIIKHILSNEGRYAIIGLPCFCKGIRLAMQLNPKLQGRVKFVLGLACGQTKSKSFAEYICALGDGDPNCLDQFTFRVKDPSRPASDFGMKSVCRTGTKQVYENVVFWTEGIAPIWCDRYFTLNSCNFCDDLFAEVADVCFMDAWLPEYSSDWNGHSIVLVRSKRLCSLFKGSAEEGSLLLKNLNISDVILSQQGVLCTKRDEMRERYHLAKKAGLLVPKKRIHLCRSRLSFGRKRVAKLTWLISKKSGNEWILAKKRLADFHKRFDPYIIRLRRAELFDRVSRIPMGMVRRLRRVLRT
jgi:coenzyme F420-reducing hydrogenase beta subunit